MRKFAFVLILLSVAMLAYTGPGLIGALILFRKKIKIDEGKLMMIAALVSLIVQMVVVARY